MQLSVEKSSLKFKRPHAQASTTATPHQDSFSMDRFAASSISVLEIVRNLFIDVEDQIRLPENVEPKDFSQLELYVHNVDTLNIFRELRPESCSR